MATITTAISAEGRVRSMEHDGYKGCKYEHCSMESKDCMGCKQNAVDKYKRMTQADRIRAMSNEEFAKENIYFVSALNAKEGLHYTGLDGHYYRTAEEVVEANMKWMQSEVE